MSRADGSTKPSPIAGIPPAVRGGAVAAIAVAALLIVTQVGLPGRAGGGTPTAILFSGLVKGLLNALAAGALVLIYRSHRIINFAQNALGIVGGLFAYNFASLNNWPFVLAFLTGVAVAAGTGLLFELAVVRRFFRAPRLVLTVFTIALIPFLALVVPQLDTSPIFPDIDDRTLEQQFGQDVRLPFPGFTFQLGDFPLTFGFGHIFAGAIAVLSLIALGAFLRYARMGTAIRAAAENEERARLLGINVGSLSMIIWTIAGAFAGVAVIGQSSMAGQFTFQAVQPELLFVALAAAIVARMRSISVAVFSAVLLTVFIDAFEFSYEQHAGLVPAMLFAVIVVGLLIQRERRGRSEDSEATSWRAVEEPRPIPMEMLALSGVQTARRVALGILAVGLLMYPFVATTRQTNLAGYYLIIAMVMVSLTVLTGWTGQVSLGQFAFVAIGAVLGGALTARAGVSFWLVIFIVPILTAAITVLIGIPALRIRGLFLAVATFALAFAVHGALFRPEYFGWILPEQVERPVLLLFDFADERSMYFLCLVSLAVIVVVVGALRRSRVGRVLIGGRDNENNLRAFGVSPVRMRLVAFAISGFICGFAGVLLAHHQRAVTEAGFEPFVSVNVFVFAVVGGVGSVFGVLLGAAHFALIDLFPGEWAWLILLVGPALILGILWVAPGGWAQITMALRDSALRIVATRRQMVVPSLFADYDPEALERRLAPLAPPIPGAGIEAVAAMPGGRRYQRDSELYRAHGDPTAARRRRVDQDAAAIGAAADAAMDGEGETR